MPNMDLYRVVLTNRKRLEAARAHARVEAARRAKGDPAWPEEACQRLIAYYERLVAEEDRLRALPVPASFTGRKADPPESLAARAQLDFAKGRLPRMVPPILGR